MPHPAGPTTDCRHLQLVRSEQIQHRLRVESIRFRREQLNGVVAESRGLLDRAGQVVPQDERSSESCLHCEINDLVEEHIEGQEAVDIGEVAARMAESLVDLVLRAPEEQQAQLLAATMTYVGQAFLEKTGAIAGESSTVQ